MPRLDPIPVRVVDLHFVTLDPTERSLHAIFDAASEFQYAITAAETPSQCVQLRERLKVVTLVFTKLQDQAAEKHDAITSAL